MNKIIIIISCFISFQVYATDTKELNSKVARNAINCFVGHKMAGSYVPQIANRYMAASIVLIGVKKTYALIDSTEKNVKLALSVLSSSEKLEGIELVYKFCPKIHKLTLPSTPLGKKIDNFAKKYDKKSK